MIGHEPESYLQSRCGISFLLPFRVCHMSDGRFFFVLIVTMSREKKHRGENVRMEERLTPEQKKQLGVKEKLSKRELEELMGKNKPRYERKSGRVRQK